MNKCIWMVLFCWASLANGASWTPILKDSSQLELIEESPQVIQDKVVFRARQQGALGLWVYDNTSKLSRNLVPAIEDRHLYELTQYQDEVFFLLSDVGNRFRLRLWKTDGTVAGTVQVNDVDIRRSLRHDGDVVVHEDLLFGYGNNGAILVYNGEQMRSFEVELYDANLSTACVFGPDDFIAYDYFEPRLIRVTDAVVTELTANIPHSHSISGLVEINNDCYVLINQGFSSRDPKDVLKIESSGEIKLLSELTGLVNINQVFQHNERVHVINTVWDEAPKTALSRLSEDQATIDFQWEVTGGYFSNAISLQQQLFVQFNENTTGVVTQYYLDQAMSPTSIRSGSRLEPPDHHVVGSASVLIYERDNAADQFEIDVFTETGLSMSLNSIYHQNLRGANSETSEAFFALMKDQKDGRNGIYLLSPDPQVGSLMNGLWVAPNLQNQGFSIRQGQRALGSNYVFVTLYTYQNGEPFWVAGTANYVPDQANIDIDLYHYEGTQFLELVEQPMESQFGQMNLKMVGCDRMQVSINHDGQSHDFEVFRIDNRDLQYLCLKPTGRQ